MTIEERLKINFREVWETQDEFSKLTIKISKLDTVTTEMHQNRIQLKIQLKEQYNEFLELLTTEGSKYISQSLIRISPPFGFRVYNGNKYVERIDTAKSIHEQYLH